MKIELFNTRITKIMKFVEFHKRIIKIMIFFKFDDDSDYEFDFRDIIMSTFFIIMILLHNDYDCITSLFCHDIISIVIMI